MSACSSEPPGFADLEGDGPSQKDVPAVVVADLDDAEAASYRWVGEHDGSDLWLGLGTPEERVCLVAYVDDDEWVHSCGVTGDGTPMTVSGYGTFYVVRDGHDAPDGASAVSANVYAD